MAIRSVWTWAAALLALAAGAGATPLGPGDVLRVTILDLPGVSGTYPVGEDGAVSLPGLGLAQAAGLDVRAVEDRVRALAGRTLVAPAVGVEVAEWRPLHVLGEVAQAGRHAFAPGATVMQALALAGGARRPPEEPGEFLRMLEVARAARARDAARIDLGAARLTLARLQAEDAGAAAFPAPDAAALGLADDAQTAALIAREGALFDERAAAQTERLAQIAENVARRRSELDAYDARIAQQEQLLAQVAAELADMRDLRERGVATVARLNELAREDSRTRGDLIQTEILKRQSLVALAELDGREVDLRRTRADEIAAGRRATLERIARLQAEIAADDALIALAAAPLAPAPAAALTFAIHRAGALAVSDAELSTPLQPGDTVLVGRAPPP